jgi:zinc D-Ala-D-Ala dipeptidase
MHLVEIKPPAFDADFFIAYATEHNFTGRAVYKKPLCYLHPDAARCLEKAIELASALGYRFKIFDAFRPQEAQEALWAHTPDPEFLADPAIGSNHSRGVAIDLTLLGKSGRELDMGTGFDAFTPHSHHAVTEISQEAQVNRFLLLGIMTAAGWDYNKNEWWHYQLHNASTYPLLRSNDLGLGMI